MGFGDIIKRSWHITWRYRALWVLGLFAGVTGASGSGGSGGGGNSFNPSSDSGGSGTGDFFRDFNPADWADQLSRFLPAIVAGTMLLVAIGFVFWILGIAARGGLIHAVDTIEEGGSFTLGSAWDAGFGRFWRLLGLSVLLGLPVVLVGLGLAAAVIVPILGAIRMGSDPSPALFAPMCGAFVIGIPLLIVGGFILGVMSLLGTRLIMLTDAGVFKAAGDAWHLFRTRIKDTLIMWFITLGLNIVASIVVAIPIAVIAVAAVIPAVFLISSQSWPALIGVSAVGVLLIVLVSMLYSAIWGTFTSALWTIFFRRLTGREVLEATAAPVPVPAPTPAAPPAPVAPVVPSPPAAPAAPEGATL